MRKVTIFILLFLSFATSASAEPKFKMRTKYYTIHGKTRGELHTEMQRKGPGSSYGYTNWFVHWDYKTGQDGLGCGLTSLNISAEIVITLPKWAEEKRGSVELRKKWDKFLTALTEHEEGHKKNGIDAAWDVEEAMKRAAHQGGDCQSVERAVEAAAQTVLHEHNAFDTQYDAETEHGMKYGAAL